ncbi:Uncharacterised protein [Bordetella pertussis]|nr:Uncharacterised protein [Bordetella pertussis]CFU79991.1 Uncharacterised protein [Bordetella pertussis]CPH83069.1 Uncharacterised protein [Bordetella pertussis]CPM58685.1 Uncharacterised protein [Bordetella pertussis]CPN22987.1 Uncharacterised protein [Bordetella pertussis]
MRYSLARGSSEASKATGTWAFRFMTIAHLWTAKNRSVLLR